MKSKELKLLRKKLEKANKWSYALDKNGRPANDNKVHSAASKKEDLMENCENNIVIKDKENDKEISVMLQYWNLECMNKFRLQEFLDLFEKNMGDLYRKSSWGLNMEEKKAEMTHNRARFLVLLDSEKHAQKLGGQTTTNDACEEGTCDSDDLIGYCHYRFELDDEDSPSQAVLYVYELEIKSKFHHQGLGHHLMKVTESMAQTANISKVMLTVFRANGAAMAFYRSMGYSVDESSPSKHGIFTDYEILSKEVL
jgi:ribosomal protein S18 acetylase RimI-like enzyme